MIEHFEIWLVQEKLKIESIGYSIDINKVLSTDHNSIRVDLDSDDLIARMTIEEDGICTLEIINVSSEETVFYNRIILNRDDCNFDDLFSNFIDKLKHTKTQA